VGALAGIARTAAAAAATAERTLGLAGPIGRRGGTMCRMTIGALRMALAIARRLFGANAIALAITLAVAGIAALAMLSAV